ncbi:hypothetical protein [Streptomyces sp. NPDC050564]|uniref:hypothetical protein n=1 Tax=Streptomyces sp. NPDC050564 TaxID=3365631 RepID=UPI0037B4B6F7
MLPAESVRPRPHPTTAGVAAEGPLLLAAVALAFTLAQLLFVAPGLHLGWDETVYASQVAPTFRPRTSARPAPGACRCSSRRSRS